jgi:hypothetical protein
MSKEVPVRQSQLDSNEEAASVRKFKGVRQPHGGSDPALTREVSLSELALIVQYTVHTWTIYIMAASVRQPR